ncbi:protein TonB [Rhodoblastus acidophilus]|uniref:energy transducer TonB n=1 Tax=Rhodoblastus acidophilus TaxID=1074 RepID=UPI002225352B|nr:energy transducer TonB [Rhodoblastus acidophilus]MCW2318235.1 protein TonB [Rhodoblastus acidophilus]
MSEIALEPVSASAAPRLRPFWLRPTALALILAAHAAALITLKPTLDSAPQLDSLEVGLVPLGDSEADQKRLEEIKPAETPEPPPPPDPPAADLTPPPPETVAPEAPPPPVAKPDDRPSPAELRRIERRKREAEEKRERAREEARREAREQARERREAQEARQEARRGAAQGAARASGMSVAAYGGLVVAELNRHKFFPAAAREAGVTGAVGVAFTIGASGRVVSGSITRSSGNAALDGAARAILAAIHTPPPPGGRFSTMTSIRFNLN